MAKPSGGGKRTAKTMEVVGQHSKDSVDGPENMATDDHEIPISVSSRKSKKKLKIKRIAKVRGNLSRSRLNGIRNTSLNSTMVKQSLRSNNRALARALESVRAELNLLTQQNLELQEIQQGLMVRNTTLERVAGLKDGEIDKEVEDRVKKRMVEVRGVLSEASIKMNGVSSSLLATVHLLGEAMSMCSGLATRASTSSSNATPVSGKLLTDSPESNSSPEIFPKSAITQDDKVEPSACGIQSSVYKTARGLVSAANSIQKEGVQPPLCDMSMIMEQSYLMDASQLGPLPFTDDEDQTGDRLSAISEKSERVSRSRSSNRRSTGLDRRSQLSVTGSPNKLRKSGAGQTFELPTCEASRKSLRRSSRRRTLKAATNDETVERQEQVICSAKETAGDTVDDVNSTVEMTMAVESTNQNFISSKPSQMPTDEVGVTHFEDCCAQTEKTYAEAVPQEQDDMMDDETVLYTYIEPKHFQSSDGNKFEAVSINPSIVSGNDISKELKEVIRAASSEDCVIDEDIQSVENGNSHVSKEALQPQENPVLEVEQSLENIVPKLVRGQKSNQRDVGKVTEDENVIQLSRIVAKAEEVSTESCKDMEEILRRQTIESTSTENKSSDHENINDDINSSEDNVDNVTSKPRDMNKRGRSMTRRHITANEGAEDNNSELQDGSKADVNHIRKNRSPSITRRGRSVCEGENMTDSSSPKRATRSRSKSISRQPEIIQGTRSRSRSVNRRHTFVRNSSASDVDAKLSEMLKKADSDNELKVDQDISKDSAHSVQSSTVVRRTRSRSRSVNRRQTYVAETCTNEVDAKLAQMLKKIENDNTVLDGNNEKHEAGVVASIVESKVDGEKPPEPQNRGRPLSRRETFVKAAIPDNETKDYKSDKREPPLRGRSRSRHSRNCDEDIQVPVRRGRSITRHAVSVSSRAGSPKVGSLPSTTSDMGNSTSQTRRQRSPSIARRGRSRSSVRKETDETTEVRATRSRSRSAVRNKDDAGTQSRGRSASRRETFVTRPEDIDPKLAEMLKKAESSPKTGSDTQNSQSEDEESANSSSKQRREEAKSQAPKKSFVSKLPTPNFKRTCLIGKSNAKLKERNLAQRNVGASPECKSKRRETYAVNPQETASKSDRRGTFVLPVKDITAEKSSAIISSDTAKDRRGTYFVSLPVNEHLSVENLVDEGEDILVESGTDTANSEPLDSPVFPSSDIAQKKQETDISGSVVHEKDPVESNLQNVFFPAEETVRIEVDMEFTEVVSNSIQSFPSLVPNKLNLPSFITKENAREPPFLKEVHKTPSPVQICNSSVESGINSENHFDEPSEAIDEGNENHLTDNTAITNDTASVNLNGNDSSDCPAISTEVFKKTSSLEKDYMFVEPVKMIKKKRTKSRVHRTSESSEDDIAIPGLKDLQEQLQCTDKPQNKFTAWMSQPGKIIFTAGRKDIMDITMPAKKPRSKAKSTLPAKSKPRSKVKTSRSKPRLESQESIPPSPDVPKSVFDFGKKTKLANGEVVKNVFDMSLSDSLCVEKPTFGQYIGRKPIPEKPPQPEEEQKDKIELPKKKNRSKARLAEKYHPKISQMTDSPHGIMLVLGDGKRTKPRSKMSKQVCIATVGDGDVTMRETHIISPSKTAAPTPTKVQITSQTGKQRIMPPTPPKFHRSKLAPDTPPGPGKHGQLDQETGDVSLVPESPNSPKSSSALSTDCEQVPATSVTTQWVKETNKQETNVKAKRKSRVSQISEMFSSEDDITSPDEGLDSDGLPSVCSKPRRKLMENESGEVGKGKNKKKEEKRTRAKETTALDNLRKKLNAIRNRESSALASKTITVIDHDTALPSSKSQATKETLSEPTVNVDSLPDTYCETDCGSSSNAKNAKRTVSVDSNSVQNSEVANSKEIEHGEKRTACTSQDSSSRDQNSIPPKPCGKDIGADTRNSTVTDNKDRQNDSNETSCDQVAKLKQARQSCKSSKSAVDHKGRNERPVDIMITSIKTEILSDVEGECDGNYSSQRSSPKQKSSRQPASVCSIGSPPRPVTKRTSSQEPDVELELPSKRPRRGGSTVNYKEPTSNRKMRRGDPGSSTIYSGNASNLKSKKVRAKGENDPGSGQKRSALATITNDLNPVVKQEV